MKSTLTIIIFIICSLFYCSDKVESSRSGNHGKAIGDEELTCLNLLELVDIEKISILCSKHTTSTVLSSKELEPFKQLHSGANVGRYYLFYRTPSAIVELGELTVSFMDDPLDWELFSEDEDILAITIKDSAISLGDHLKIGRNLNDVVNYLGEPKFTNGAYLFESHCENVKIVTNAEGRIVTYSVFKK